MAAQCCLEIGSSKPLDYYKHFDLIVINMQIDTITMWLPKLSDWPGPRYQAIASAISADIEAGTLSAGAQLPTQRALADRLGVTVGTVSRGYMLADERGLVRCEIGRGTFVRDPSSRGGHVMAAPIDTPVLDLSVNMPIGDANSDALADSLKEIAKARGVENLLKYMPPEGHREHRAAAAAWSARAGANIAPERIVMTHGAQQGLATVFDALTAPGDTVLVESLTYPGLITNARLNRVRLATVDIDAEGMLPDALERKIRQTNAKIAVLVPTIQNPTAAVMGESRRQAIASIAARHGIMLVEDDVYGYLPAERPTPFVTMLPEQTIYVGAASKCLAPGLRVGWLAAPARLVRRFSDVVYARCVAQPALSHEIFRRWVAERTADVLLARLRRDTAERQAMATRVLAGFTLRAHPASFHLMLELPLPWRRDEFVAAAREEDVLIASISSFAVDVAAAPEAVRVSVAAVRSHRELEAALLKLREILDREPLARHKLV